ncbi:MAG: DNA polymerase III subunit delta [Bacillota bacterium]
MDHNAFFAAIKHNSIARVYLFHGEEEFVKERALERLLARVDGPAREMNIGVLEQTDADALRSACDTLPFFSEERIVIVRTLPTDVEAKKIAEYLPRIPPSTILVFFVRGSADGRLTLFKAIAALDGVVDFFIFDEAESAKWVLSTCKKLGVTMDPPVARQLVALVGTSIGTLNNELTKAADYVGRGGRITNETLLACVTPEPEYKIFEMLGCFLAGDAGGGFRALDGLIKNGQKPIEIASFLAGRFRQMLQARQFLDSGMNRDAAARALGGNPYAAKKSVEAAQRFDAAELARATMAFLNVRYLQISGRQKDRESLELALLTHMPRSRGQKRPGTGTNA